MPRNASGIYTLPAGNPVTPGDVVDAAWANSTLSDIATELTNSLSRTGAGGMIAPFRVADGSVTTPGVAFLNETNTGLYRASAGTAAMSILGVNTATFSTVGLTIPSTKALTAQGNASVGGTLSVTGATTLSSTLAVTGAITATGGVVGNVTGNVTAAAGSSSFNDVVISGSLDMTVGSSATITGLSTPTNASDAANKGYVDTQDALRLALTGGTLTGALAMSTNKITGLGTPTADTDAANKSYVDSVAQGLDAKASCRAATTASISLSGTQTIDGVAVIAGDRVLVKDQSSAAENGIYVAAAGAWARASDANTWDELVSAFTFVEQGTTNGNNGYICTISAGGTLGVTAVTWAQFSGAGQINAGTGMSKTGNTLNVNTASSARIVVGADEIDLATTGVVASTYKSVTVDQWGRVTGGTNPTTLAGYGISDAYTTTQVDNALALKLNLTGGTMSGAIAMGTNKITGMGDPTNPQDAATKNYIDTIFGSTASAAASASAAATSASNASTSASNAASSATSASSSAAAAAASFDSFDDRYLGAKTSDPTLDNDGNALITGALYFNSVASEMRVYTGSAWLVAYLPATGYVALTGDQTVAGTKTFSSTIVGSVSGNAGTVTNGVYTTGDQTINGNKTFTNTIAGSISGNAGTVTNGVYTTGNQTIGGNKLFSGSVSIGGSNSPATNLDVQTTGANALTSLFTTGLSDLNFRIGAMNGAAGSTGTTQGKLGLFYLGVGETATIDFRRGATTTDGSFAFRTSGTDRATLDNSGNFTATGNVTAYSDERLKKDWAPLPGDFVERLAGVKAGTYTRIDTGERQAGASAQDWQRLLPEVVGEGEHLSLAYGNAALVSAAALAQRVVDLERRLAALEK